VYGRPLLIPPRPLLFSPPPSRHIWQILNSHRLRSTIAQRRCQASGWAGRQGTKPIGGVVFLIPLQKD